MKRIIILFVFSLLVIAVAQAQEIDNENNFLLEKDIFISDIFTNRLDLYNTIPTSLWQWNYDNISSIRFNQFYNSKDFKTVDEFNKDYGFSFQTESVQAMPEKGWVFYGKFAFRNSTHKTTSFNMFYAKSRVGSPFRVVTERNGDFRVKHYGLVGGLSKKLNNAWAIGAQVDYAGDLYFRTLDTRNEQYNLTVDATLAVSYSFNTNQSLSLGLAYYYKKTTNSYSNEFKTSGSEYYLYNLNGLGDFNKAEINDNLIITDQNPKLLLSYFSGTDNKLSLHLSFYPGNDEWNNKIRSINSETPEQLYKYEYLENIFTGTYLISKSTYEFFNKITTSFILGDGYEYRGGTFQPTYLYEGATVTYSSDLYRNDKKLFYKNKLNILFENVRKKDMTYAQQMKYSNLSIEAKTGYYIPINPKNKLTVDATINYKLNLDYLHDVVAAESKPYTRNLAYNEMAYNTADVIQMGGEATWYGRLGKLKAEYKLQYNYITPIEIRIINNYSLLETHTNKTNIAAHINLYF